MPKQVTPHFCTPNSDATTTSCPYKPTQNPYGPNGRLTGNCESCHVARHNLNLSPVDVVFVGLCNTPECQMERCLSNDTSGDKHFTVCSTVEGLNLRTLLDTGATTNFISERFVNEHDKLLKLVGKIPGFFICTPR
eukprot:SAG31_NODE_1082_length_10014_cov_5.324962_2_plen_136_part_00